MAAAGIPRAPDARTRRRARGPIDGPIVLVALAICATSTAAAAERGESATSSGIPTPAASPAPAASPGATSTMPAASPAPAATSTMPAASPMAASPAPAAPAPAASTAPAPVGNVVTSPARPAGLEPPRPLAKKDQDLADKRARAAATLTLLPPETRVGQKPAPLINVFHRWTQEDLAISAVGPLPPTELQNRLLRDHYTNQSTAMAAKLVPALVAAAKRFRVARVEVVSGYRHPKYNLILRKKGHQVARDSEHTHGQAVDFHLPGVTTVELYRWALARRMGGVGIYLQSGFVHVDVGAVRHWSGD
jgi:uncharacterized protein YcbK (DUF882 family)